MAVKNLKDLTGKISRCRFNGDNVEDVITDLTPTCLDIDNKNEFLYVVASPSIFGFKLSKLENITATTVQDNLYPGKNYSIKYFLPPKDIKIHKNVIYIAILFQSHMFKINMTKRLIVTEDVEPKDFAMITNLAIYSDVTQRYIDLMPNPCNTTKCLNFCVAKDSIKVDCVCLDTQADDLACHATGTVVDTVAPYFDDTCPNDMHIQTSSCETSALIYWWEPQWKDDVTESSKLELTVPHISSPYLFGAGEHRLVFTAKDQAANVGICEFTITVITNRCSDHERQMPLLYGIEYSEMSCGLLVGSIYNITCKDPNKKLWHQSKFYDSYTVVCMWDKQWIGGLDADTKCVSDPNNTSNIGFSTTRPISKFSDFVTNQSGDTEKPASNAFSTSMPVYSLKNNNITISSTSLSGGALAGIIIAPIILLIMMVITAVLIIKRIYANPKFMQVNMRWNKMQEDNVVFD